MINEIIKVEKFIFNDFEQNTYVVYHADSKEAIVIDPGNSNEIENEEIEFFIKNNHLNLIAIINTHGHIDHIFGVAFLKEFFDAKFYFPSPDLPLLNNVELQAEMIGIRPPRVVSPDFDLHGFKKLNFSDLEIEVIKTPGHSPGGTCLLIKSINKIFTGDTIFFESIGRTDLWGGDYDQLLVSINEKILTLDEDIEILPGHGQSTTIKHEKMFNPFLK